MTYVVVETCIKCKWTDCVDVCPVDCFREGPNMLVIDPDECIDCTLCVAECPEEAIYADDDVHDDQKDFMIRLLDAPDNIIKVKAATVLVNNCTNGIQIIEQKAAIEPEPFERILRHVKSVK